MIIKSKSYKRDGVYEPLIAYLLRESELEHSFVYTKYIKTKDHSVKSLAKAFRSQEQQRIHQRKNSVKLRMFILSFKEENTKDLTHQKLKRISRKFLSLLPPSMAMVTAHTQEKSHPHVHILTSGIDNFGKSNRISKKRFLEIKLEMESYCKKHYTELEPSFIEHNPSKGVKKNA